MKALYSGRKATFRSLGYSWLGGFALRCLVQLLFASCVRLGEIFPRILGSGKGSERRPSNVGEELFELLGPA